MLMMRPQRCLSMETETGLNAQISRGEIRLQHAHPSRHALHAHDELVAGDAGIIHQNIDLAELRRGRLDGGLDLLFVGDVER